MALFPADDAREDLECVIHRCGRLLFISTDFVYDPARRAFPRYEDAEGCTTEGYGRSKREAELVFERSEKAANWTVCAHTIFRYRSRCSRHEVVGFHPTAFFSRRFDMRVSWPSRWDTSGNSAGRNRLMSSSDGSMAVLSSLLQK